MQPKNLPTRFTSACSLSIDQTRISDRRVSPFGNIAAERAACKAVVDLPSPLLSATGQAIRDVRGLHLLSRNGKDFSKKNPVVFVALNQPSAVHRRLGRSEGLLPRSRDK
jgi:hypothetical protein